MVKVIGVTGQIGMGKTYAIGQIIQAFQETGEEATLISIDDIRRNVILEHIYISFDEFWQENGDKIRQVTQDKINDANGFVFIEWPRLIEDGFVKFLDAVLIINCEREIQQRRLYGGDLPIEEVKKRISRQMSAEETQEQLDIKNWIFNTCDNPQYSTYQKLAQKISDDTQ